MSSTNLGFSNAFSVTNFSSGRLSTAYTARSRRQHYPRRLRAGHHRPRRPRVMVVRRLAPELNPGLPAHRPRTNQRLRLHHPRDPLRHHHPDVRHIDAQRPEHPLRQLGRHFSRLMAGCANARHWRRLQWHATLHRFIPDGYPPEHRRRIPCRALRKLRRRPIRCGRDSLARLHFDLRAFHPDSIRHHAPRDRRTRGLQTQSSSKLK